MLGLQAYTHILSSFKAAHTDASSGLTLLSPHFGSNLYQTITCPTYASVVALC